MRLKKIQKILYNIFSIIIFVILCTSIIYADEYKRPKKGGYNIFPSKGPIIEEDHSETKIIKNEKNQIDMIFAENVVTLQDKLRVGNIYDTIVFGSYEQDGNLENGKEPIEWMIIHKEDDGKVLLTSKYILDCQKFNTYPANITWERSTLREWLNNYFYDVAFTDTEKKYVLETLNQNKKNYFYNTDCGAPTMDKVFLLSIEEAIKYFEPGVDYYTQQQNCLKPNAYRQCKPTPYAIAKGVRTSVASEQSYGYANYWLRTMGKNVEREWYSGIFAKYYAAIVQEPGYIKPMGTAIHSCDDGVRPCIWLESN